VTASLAGGARPLTTGMLRRRRRSLLALLSVDTDPGTAIAASRAIQEVNRELDAAHAKAQDDLVQYKATAIDGGNFDG